MLCTVGTRCAESLTRSLEGKQGVQGAFELVGAVHALSNLLEPFQTTLYYTHLAIPAMMWFEKVVQGTSMHVNYPELVHYTSLPMYCS
jgi:hypothetical protein